MAVHKIRLTVLITLSCVMSFISNTMADEKNHTKEAVLELLSRKVLTATANYGERIKQCNHDKQHNQAPTLSEDMLTGLSITREEAIIALSYLQFNNYYRCVRTEQHALGFHLETLSNLKRSLGETDPKATLQSEIVYPSERELLLEVNYLHLSNNKRAYFEHIIGDKVFDLHSALQANHLFIE